MHRTTFRRRLLAILCGLAMVAGIAAGGATPASAKTPPGKNLSYEWTNAGDVEFEVTGGIISLNNGLFEVDLGAEPDPDAEPTDPITFTGTIDAAGNVLVPTSGVSFPEAEIEEGDLTLNVTIQAASDSVGLLDPKTGDSSMSIALQIVIDPNLLGVTCTINLGITMTSDGPGGAAYSKAGTATLADDTLAVPNTSGSGLLAPLVCPQVNSALGLPAPAGTNLVAFTFVTDPVLSSKVVPPGTLVETKSDCEGTWSNDEGTKSCTVLETYETVIETDDTGVITHPDNTSGTNRWRATIRTTVIGEGANAVSDSQQGALGSLGTGETYEQVVEDQGLTGETRLEHSVQTCQQTSILGTWQNRALDSPRCVDILNLYIASL